MKVLGVIPARGGSKGVPLKNSKELNKKPLIAYTIETAQKSQGIDRLVVSTDHLSIRDIAREYGCEVIERPQEFARDESPTEDALIHALEYLREKDGASFDLILTLEPTSPFRTTQTIERCIEIFNSHDYDSAIAVVETRSCYGKNVDGRFTFLIPGQPRRRQERVPLFKESSTLYATKTDTLIKKHSVLGDALYPLVVSEEEAFDINTEQDFYIAESLMQLRQKGGAL